MQTFLPQCLKQVQIREAAEGWLCTPYHHKAKIKGVGVDCAQLLIAVFQEVGLLPVDFSVGHYPQDWHLHRGIPLYLNWIKQYCYQVEKPKTGDIALFCYGRCDSHAGIVISETQLIHAYRGQGVVRADFVAEGELSQRLTGFWRVKSI
jgi:cell wall-associated NlpC family hydrolase